jgi:hypothetical protein
MDAPKAYKDGGVAVLVSGIFNVMTAGIWVLSLFWICIGFFWLIPMAIGAWQAWVGYQMMQGQPNGQAKTASIAGIVAGVLNLNPIGIIGAIFGMMACDKPETRAFLEG